MCSSVLPKPMPGSTASRSRGMPAAAQAASRGLQESEDLERRVVIARIELHGARLALHVHQDRRRAAARRPGEASRIARQRRDVVDDPGAAGRSPPPSPRRGGCRSRPAAPAAASAPDHRHDAGDLVATGTGSAPGRVNSPPTSRMSAPSPSIARPRAIAASAVERFAAVGEAVGRDVDDAHDQRAVER